MSKESGKMTSTQDKQFSLSNPNQKFHQFEDEEAAYHYQDQSHPKQQSPHLNTNQQRSSSQDGGSSKARKKRRKFINKAKNLVSQPFQNNQFYQQAAIDFKNQNKGQRIRTVFSGLICGYWMLNSILGFYILYQYPHLQQTHPLIYLYLLAFSSKWVAAFFVSLILMLTLCLILKVCCSVMDVCHNTVGGFPVMYIMVIIMSYMYSLYYGVVIIKEIYAPQDNEDQDYNQLEDLEQTLLKIFVLNEVIVGAYIILIFLYSLFCSGLRKSEHLREIEGEDYGINELEIQRYREEIQESRVRTESLRKEKTSKIFEGTHGISSQMVREEMIKEIQEENLSMRMRSVSQDPNNVADLRSSIGLSKSKGSPLNKRTSMSPEYTNTSLKTQNIQGHTKNYSQEGSSNSPLKQNVSSLYFNHSQELRQAQDAKKNYVSNSSSNFQHTASGTGLINQSNSFNQFHINQQLNQPSQSVHSLIKTNDHSFEKGQPLGQERNSNFNTNDVNQQQQFQLILEAAPRDEEQKDN